MNEQNQEPTHLIAEEIFTPSYTVQSGGNMFILHSGDLNYLNKDLAACVEIGLKNEARVIGMISGILQLFIAGSSQEILTDKCKRTGQMILTRIENRGVVVSTVQNCPIGAWGDETWMNYGVIVPDMKKMLSSISTAKLGDNLVIM